MATLPGAEFLNSDGTFVGTTSESTNQPPQNTSKVEILSSSLNVKSKEFGAIGNGLSNPLKDRFNTLAEMWQFYPNANNLEQEQDWAAIQKAINKLGKTGGTIYIPRGKYILNRRNNTYQSLWCASNNIVFQGDGPQHTILKGKDKETVLLLFGGTNEQFKNVSFYDLWFEGTNANDADALDPYSIRSSLLAIFGKSNTEFTENVTIKNCAFSSIVRDGIQLGYLNGVKIQNCSFNYYDYDNPVPPNPGNYHKVGVFAGAQSVVNLLIESNYFNGNKNGNSIFQEGADGFVSISKGGNILITNNIIENYKIEGIHCNAAPLSVVDNIFTTKIGRFASTALLAFPDTANSDPNVGSFVIKPDYSFVNNKVYGGVGGVWHRLHSFDSTNIIKITSTISNNHFFLNRDLTNYPVVASNAKRIKISENYSENFYHFFISSSVAQGTQFLNEFVEIRDNTLLNGMDAIFNFSSEIEKLAIIKNNLINTMGTHLRCVRPSYNPEYRVVFKNNEVIDDDGFLINARIDANVGNSGGIVKVILD